ncbi:MAG: Spx/MgsR family RNA polymerase-binding regulatory protein [Erysipelotrichaceae bacterium]
MVILYTSAGCVSCRKAKHFLKINEIPYLEKNIFNVLLDPKEISYLLSRSENGTDDIISKRSKIISSGKVDIEKMTVNELIDFIQHNPSILKRPIIIDINNLLVGYDEEEIESFLPRGSEQGVKL